MAAPFATRSSRLIESPRWKNDRERDDFPTNVNYHDETYPLLFRIIIKYIKSKLINF